MIRIKIFEPHSSMMKLDEAQCMERMFTAATWLGKSLTSRVKAAYSVTTTDSLY